MCEFILTNVLSIGAKLLTIKATYVQTDRKPIDRKTNRLLKYRKFI